MKNGLLITMEGTDGAGKSTQTLRITKYLTDMGIDFIFTREPGGTKISEEIRNIILDTNNSEMDYMTEALLYAASRAQHVAEVITPALAENKLVVCDRYIDSSIVYQGFARGLGDDVLKINLLAVKDCLPDVTFLLSLSGEETIKRMSNSKKDRLELEGEKFHQTVYDGYQKLAEVYPERIISIDAAKTKDEVTKEIIGHLEKILLVG
ncbi:MAG: dTMP kinase [Anaerovoracaceae bacterium]